MRRPFIHFLVLVSAGWVGCSSDRGSFVSAPREFGDPDAGLEAVDAGCTGVVCSRDLRSVRDCDGNVVKECEADKACGNGACVTPCNAAAINEGSVGCSFAIPGQNSTVDGRGSCAAFFVANNWTSPATLHLEYDGQELSLADAVWVPVVEDGVLRHEKLDGPIPPGGAAVVFLSNEDTGVPYWIACPRGVKPIFDKEQAVYGTGIGHAVLASADVPVSMYSIFPYGGARSNYPSATLLLPTTSFRKNYVVAGLWGGRDDLFGTNMLPNSGGLPSAGAPTLQIVATEDDTSVDILPPVDIVGGRGLHPSPRNVVANYKLKRGEVMQLTQHRELVGSVVETSKPVGVFAGVTCVQVPSDIGYCDIENKQIPPLSAWGHEYAVLPAPNRIAWVSKDKESERDWSVIRMVGAVDGTELVYEPGPPDGAPATLQSGQLARFFSYEPFVVRSQDSAHPFYVASLMTGAGASATMLGDPETAIAVPTDQWLDSYLFYSDATYPFSSVFVTRRRVDGGFHDVTLDCAGPLTGWKAFGADYEWTYARLTHAGKAVAYDGSSCTDGAHRIQSGGPFSMTVWGIGVTASYAYPGGAGLRPISDVHVPAVVH